jgi:hypothetical protein
LAGESGRDCALLRRDSNDRATKLLAHPRSRCTFHFTNQQSSTQSLKGGVYVKSQSVRDDRTSTSNGTTEFSFSAAPLYADKDEFLGKNLVFTIKGVEFQEGAGFEGADRWAVTVSPSDGRLDEIITLQSNDNRDDQLRAAADHINKHGPIPNTKLVKSGKAYYFRKATETANP